MSWSTEFRDRVLEVFEPLGPITARPMFGGVGVYLDGLMFALISDDTLYLKVDEATRPAFVAAGLEPFEYTARGKTVRMSYHQAPAEVFESREAAEEWGRRALEAARSSAR